MVRSPEGGAAPSTQRPGEGSTTDDVTNELSIQTREEEKHPPRDQHASKQRHMNDHGIPGMQRIARLEARVHIHEQQD